MVTIVLWARLYYAWSFPFFVDNGKGGLVKIKILTSILSLLRHAKYSRSASPSELVFALAYSYFSGQRRQIAYVRQSSNKFVFALSHSQFSYLQKF
jgi:hypothetical protein